MRNFDDLSQKEVLALAISSEEEDGRIYAAARSTDAAVRRLLGDLASAEAEHLQTAGILIGSG